MNYINNHATMRCCSFDSSDIICVEPQPVFVDTVSGEVCDFNTVKTGHCYNYETHWALSKSYVVIAYYPTEATARAAYNDLIDKIADTNNVISVTEG
jgi:hypothetical protein|nr:MAG TPA: hypothetical protein [Caudoviricetes sp.]DAN06981.1 MAG TPA: hypothetical protein [Caudoviricetes sp.]